MTMHPLLKRQLKRIGADAVTPPDPAAWAMLLERVSAAYREGEDERYLLERSLEISSHEMRELYEARARSEERQAVLRKVATAVAGCRAPAEVADLALELSSEAIGSPLSLIWMKESESEPNLPAMAPHVRRAMEGGATVWDASGVAVPLLASGRVRGVITGDGIAHEDSLDQLLCDLSDLVALSLINAEATAQLTARATTDPLTGLANHRTFKERLDNEVRRAVRHERALGLLVMDVDDFKQVNDSYGHQVGDQVLAEIARRVKALARVHDLPARVGGEEFAVMLPETDGIGTLAAAERIRLAIESEEFPVVGRVTISVGACSLVDARSADELVNRADSALFWAKRNGRNVSYRWTPEVAAEFRVQECDGGGDQIRTLTAVRALARAVDAREPGRTRHSENVAALAHALALELGWSAGRAAALRQAALVHDVGKVGALDADQHDALGVHHQHPELGARILGDLLSEEQVSWIRAHHERPDGTGYPNGLSGSDIPDGALVIAVADCWDGLHRTPATSRMDQEQMLADCRQRAGQGLWEDGVDALHRLADQGLLDDLLSERVVRNQTEVPWA
ncbi:MAG: diguanylate cyclase [Thermoleophilia bacterium]|nr:diguanylate cyclase [Thermoleophilia bacterium]